MNADTISIRKIWNAQKWFCCGKLKTFNSKKLNARIGRLAALIPLLCHFQKLLAVITVRWREHMLLQPYRTMRLCRSEICLLDKPLPEWQLMFHSVLDNLMAVFHIGPFFEIRLLLLKPLFLITRFLSPRLDVLCLRHIFSFSVSKYTSKRSDGVVAFSNGLGGRPSVKSPFEPPTLCWPRQPEHFLKTQAKLNLFFIWLF